MKKSLNWIVTLLAFTVSVAAAGPSSQSADAIKWASLLDKGKYSQSWAEAGTFFKSHVTESEWSSQARPVREPLGAVMSRKLESETETTSLPGAPEGHYDVVKFDTDFENKRGAVETIVLAHEPGGWKVDGYFIR
jgi:hypothetical protein